MTAPRSARRVDAAFIGARGHYAVPRLLSEAGILGRFFTDAYVGNKPWLELGLRLTPPPLRPRSINRLLGRTDEAIPARSVVSYDVFGLKYWWKQQRVRSDEELIRLFVDSATEFNRLVINDMIEPADATYGCSGALELFEHVRTSGGSCVLEQLLAAREQERALLSEEKRRWPGWQPDLWIPEVDPLAEREVAEWEHANVILAASEFVAEGLRNRGVRQSKIKLVPYGLDLSRYGPPHTPVSRPPQPLRVLFAGAVGLRKGAPYLLEALRLIGPSRVEGRFAGKVELGRDKLAPYTSVARFLGAVPRNQMPQLFRWADVFVFPTVCDGFGFVQAEAIASGVPVIATPNCGSVVRDGIDGHIVPIGDAKELARALEGYIEQPNHLNRQKSEAYAGRDRLGLESYGNRLIEALREL